DPADSSIAGSVTATAAVVHPTSRFVLDLDDRLVVDAVQVDGAARSYERRGGRLRIDLTRTYQPGEKVVVRVDYGGRPRVAPNPPWDGGLTWARTEDGSPWIATSCQVTGADVWWPVKDHPSDEPDSMAIRFTVPEPLVAASNGRLRGVEDAGDGWRTYDWFVSTPINVYNVALNAAPYEAIEETHTGLNGETYPVAFYALPEDVDRARAFMPEIHDQLTFFEERFGPYPFRADKYGVAQTPHLGMEHQTIIAYGANFDNGAMTGGRDWGFDALHHHELAHEWWGNLVTNVDWSDMWLHEGFGTYTQALYMEELGGMAGYHAYMDNMAFGIQNRMAVAPHGYRSSTEIYGGDIYSKGAWVLHMLRFVIDDDPTFDRLLRRMAYPDPALEEVTDGRHVRHATTQEFVHLAEQITGRDLGWFFDVYLRQAELPRLAAIRQGSRLTLRWDSPLDVPFTLPVEVDLGGEVFRVDMEGGEAVVDVPAGVDPVIDPNNWLLADGL
ncbi:MAG: M1 family metallopeptidase, partial [Rhodothermales bacterium]